MNYSGRYFMDGIDLWLYGIVVEKGSDNFLKYAARKSSVSHDWPDRNGTEIDTSKVYLDSRPVELKMGIFADSEDDWWLKYRAFLAHLTKPGKRRIQITELGSQQFYVIYAQTTNFERFTRILNNTKIRCKFTIEFTENEPVLDNSITYLVTESGIFIVT